MKQSEINLTNNYNIFHVDGNFNIYISSHISGYFYGVILYYVYNKKRADISSFPAFEFKIQQFVAENEDSVYSKCCEWIDENLKGKYKIVKVDDNS